MAKSTEELQWLTAGLCPPPCQALHNGPTDGVAEAAAVGISEGPLSPRLTWLLPRLDDRPVSSRRTATPSLQSGPTALVGHLCFPPPRA